MGFVVDRVTLGQVLLPLLPIFRDSVITTKLHTLLHFNTGVHKIWASGRCGIG